MRVDVHQHLWTEGVYAALARRTAAPRLRSRDRGWQLELAGEPPFPLPRDPHEADRRAAVLDDFGVDIAIVALSTALGVETLPPDEAREVLDAWDADVAALPRRLSSWGSVPLAEPDPRDVDRVLDRGRIGVTLPADAIGTPAALDHVGPLLERLAARDAPLLVHPGASAAGTWLAPMTSYVASLSDAWHAWALHGRARHPALRVVFAALAGLAPLHAERLGARVDRAPVRAALSDPLTFYDTSSYGPVAVDAMLRAVGPEALVHGSDWPYAEPAPLAGPLRRAIVEDNPAALLRLRPAAVAA
ncbi:MAG TPA: amidohydrolase family protein [Solirubrobacteraceae bacterium]|jgi:predicted TIM-barrel fold metal-dependent hydrolase